MIKLIGCLRKYFIFNVKKTTGFAFPTESLVASSIARINPPFCGNTFLTDAR